MSPTEREARAKRQAAQAAAQAALAKPMSAAAQGSSPWRTAAYVIGGIAVFVVAGKLVFGR